MESTQTTPLPGTAVPAVDEVDLTPVRTYWQLVRQRFVRHRLAVIAFFLMAILIAMALFIPLLSGDAWKETSLERINQPPSLTAPLGYDNLGINTFARLMKGLQTSLFIGFSAVVVIVLIGVTVGAMAGYFGGWADNALMRFVDIVLSIPTFFLILMLVAFWGTGNAWVIIIAIGLTGWTTAARLVRAEFLSLREADFVQAAKALGAGDRRVVVRHMIPSAMAPVVVAATLGIADSVVIEAALSYLGFGITPPEASLGNMLTKAQDYFYRDPLLAWYPGVTLVLVVLAASFLGDGLRDALDPRQRVEAN
ncbi:MAG: ABC transporter permease [Chloroflexi bacterium]|jgi:peptide/nickel transport system permease protein|nr:ABC transporter permease [Chloroflexota bacterium]